VIARKPNLHMPNGLVQNANIETRNKLKLDQTRKVLGRFHQWITKLDSRDKSRENYGRGCELHVTRRQLGANTEQYRQTSVRHTVTERRGLKCGRKVAVAIIAFINIIITISFMQSIYTYIPETNHVPEEYNVASILSLLVMALVISSCVVIIIIIITVSLLAL
jgi:hypothetical protein